MIHFSFSPILLLTMLLLCSTACESNNDTTISAASLQPRETLRIPIDSEPVTYEIRAKFLDFEKGDVDHYLFEDEYGNIIDFTDFASNDEFELKEALPSNAHNAFNKGWRGNKFFQGKWFLLQCRHKKQPAYDGGPTMSIKVILNASLL